MKINQIKNSEEQRDNYRFGVAAPGMIYFCPYTGWGNTVKTLLYERGTPRNEPVSGDWQWGDEDGELYPSLEEAIAASGFPVPFVFEEYKPENWWEGPLFREPGTLHAPTATSILRALGEGKSPQELGLWGYDRISAAHIGAFKWGGFRFTQADMPGPNDWCYGRLSENGVSFRCYAKVISGELWESQWVQDHLGRSKPSGTFSKVPWP